MRCDTSARKPGGQRSQQRGGLRRVEMRQHQRDRLRVLVMDEFGELLRVGLLDGVERRRVGSERLGEPVQQALGLCPG